MVLFLVLLSERALAMSFVGWSPLDLVGMEGVERLVGEAGEALAISFIAHILFFWGRDGAFSSNGLLKIASRRAGERTSSSLLIPFLMGD